MPADSANRLAAFWILGCWGVFMAVWWVSAFRVRSAKRKESAGSRSLHGGLIVIGSVLLLPYARVGPLGWTLLPAGAWREWGAMATVAAGVAFAVWARTFLGQNWSGNVTLKEGHELIQGGPYRFARHPIYTGILLSILGTGVWQGTLAGLLAVGCFGAGFSWKIRLEEQWLTEEFGEQYREYRRRVKALIPLVF
jgi:protein-S-isoprenylcysteine O-methyltransferase Ste14